MPGGGTCAPLPTGLLVGYLRTRHAGQEARYADITASVASVAISPASYLSTWTRTHASHAVARRSRQPRALTSCNVNLYSDMCARYNRIYIDVCISHTHTHTTLFTKAFLRRVIATSAGSWLRLNVDRFGVMSFIYLRQRRRYMFSPARPRSFVCLSVCKTVIKFSRNGPERRSDTSSWRSTTSNWRSTTLVKRSYALS